MNNETGAGALVIVPTYNERENVSRVVERVLGELDGIHVLVVDDNSPDGTGQLAEELAAESDRIHVLRRPGKLGLGSAYVDGLTWGLERDYQTFIEMDADLSHPPEQLPVFLQEIANGTDVVIGSRYVGGRVTVVNWPIGRLLISLFGSWYARVITGLPVRDATGGFNAFRRPVIEELDLGRIQSNGYSFQIELKYRAWKNGRSLKEIPIVFTERDSGESKMSKRIVREAVWRVWKLRFMALMGRL
ncbi:MAG: polyprenol monophosphomannose synthase [Longimicrobiales bacterium]